MKVFKKDFSMNFESKMSRLVKSAQKLLLEKSQNQRLFKDNLNL